MRFLPAIRAAISTTASASGGSEAANTPTGPRSIGDLQPHPWGRLTGKTGLQMALEEYAHYRRLGWWGRVKYRVWKWYLSRPSWRYRWLRLRSWFVKRIMYDYDVWLKEKR